MTLQHPNTLMPIFLKLEGRRILVVGGGAIGLEKIGALLRNDPNARIHVVAPEIREEIRELAATRTITLEQQAYNRSHIEQADLVFAATSLREVNEQVAKDAREVKVLINVADTPDLCDFYMSSIVLKGDLKIAISTNGKSPTVAKRLREYFEKWIPDEINEVMQNLHVLREKLRGDFSHKVKTLNEATKVFEEEENA
ncbi:MAG: bifunctional precorrin-2 dehydrogenase/sirohydrochlorin ferrochelatase [Flavobacteriales bacterium]|nr:bifunctional precorrin-2 dehydrogenase/sirohydrochlorin ferrochelatase [Flavobacteriales bacterium]MCB9446935.1 bifunctional precorrin-2 dehydrogenase/sirohydrochlorin ferrochelatase [Flavobacteriales bacterium]